MAGKRSSRGNTPGRARKRKTPMHKCDGARGRHPAKRKHRKK